ELTGCCYRKRRHQHIENISVASLVEGLKAEGFPMGDFWRELENLVVDAFQCLASHPAMARVPHLDRRYYLGGVDVLLTDCGDAVRPLFIETNYVPQLNGWGPAVDHSLRDTHREWLCDLRSLASRLAA